MYGSLLIYEYPSSDVYTLSDGLSALADLIHTRVLKLPPVPKGKVGVLKGLTPFFKWTLTYHPYYADSIPTGIVLSAIYLVQNPGYYRPTLKKGGSVMFSFQLVDAARAQFDSHIRLAEWQALLSPQGNSL